MNVFEIPDCGRERGMKNAKKKKWKMQKKRTKIVLTRLSKFWWAGSVDKRGMHWQSWEKVVVSKNPGGMGFRDVPLFNDDARKTSLEATWKIQRVFVPEFWREDTSLVMISYRPDTQKVPPALGRPTCVVALCFSKALSNGSVMERILAYRMIDGLLILQLCDLWVGWRSSGLIGWRISLTPHRRMGWTTNQTSSPTTGCTRCISHASAMSTRWKFLGLVGWAIRMLFGEASL